MKKDKCEKCKSLIEPTDAAKALGYLAYQVVDRGVPHCDDLKEAIELFVDSQIEQFGGFRQEYEYLHVARVNLEKALRGIKVAHNKAAKEQANKCVRPWIPSDWPGIGGNR